MTYDDFLRSLSIKDILVDAGYTLNKRDGLRYPSYVRYGSDGTRIRGDKFIVTQNGNCCFRPPEQKLYNVISFIKAFPEKFTEFRGGISSDHLVNLVCNRLMNNPQINAYTIRQPATIKIGKPTLRRQTSTKDRIPTIPIKS